MHFSSACGGIRGNSWLDNKNSAFVWEKRQQVHLLLRVSLSKAACVFCTKCTCIQRTGSHMMMRHIMQIFEENFVFYWATLPQFLMLVKVFLLSNWLCGLFYVTKSEKNGKFRLSKRKRDKISVSSSSPRFKSKAFGAQV